MKILSGHQSNYLPYPGLFYKIARSDGFVFVDHVQFEKKSWQNRNRIRTKEGWIYLTVPVITKGKSDQTIFDVEINKTENWTEKHLSSIMHNYRNAPFYNEISALLDQYYGQMWEKLYQLNRSFTLLILEKLHIETPIYFSEEYLFESHKTEMLLELCAHLGYDSYLSNEGSRAYVNEEMFREKGLSHEFCNYSTPEYRQQYSPFEANLSIIDMIANVGFNNARKLIVL